MPKPQQKQIAEVHQWLNFLIHEIRVNGTDGSDPVVGIQNILEYQASNQKRFDGRLVEFNQKLEDTKTQVRELKDITQELRVKREFRTALNNLINASPMLRSLLELITWRNVIAAVGSATFLWFGPGYISKFFQWILSLLH